MDVAVTRRRGDGFSLIEVLIASAIFLTIALGVLPLFSRSLRDNRSGAESTELTNLARSRLEEFFQLPFDSPRLTLATGIELVFDEYYSQSSESWKTGAPPTADPAVWTRTTRVRQYQIGALDDGFLDPATEALAAGTAAGQIHLKEIVVQVTRVSSFFGPPKRLTLRTLKSS